jgi:hypothetical protein
MFPRFAGSSGVSFALSIHHWPRPFTGSFTEPFKRSSSESELAGVSFG